MNAKHLSWIIPLSVVIAFLMFVLGSTVEHNSRVKGEMIKGELRNYYACMNGCQQIPFSLYALLVENNISLDESFGNCKLECYKKYRETLGCDVILTESQ